MVIVDRERCGYCSSCVRLCPVDAIRLAETRIQIDSRCTECGLCIDSCPMGAIHYSNEKPPAKKLPRRRYDVVVVGCGPAGATVARVAAEKGLSVLCLEKRQEIGSPVRCAEGVGCEPLKEFLSPDPAWISCEVRSTYYAMVSGGKESGTTYGGQGLLGYVLERKVFDRVLAEKAIEAGAEIRVKSPATGLLIEDGRVVGIKAQIQGDLLEVDCSVVVGADGVESEVGRWAGLDTILSPNDSMPCAQYLLAGIDIDSNSMYYYVGEEVAPGGYAWIFPKGNGKANVGLGVQSDAASEPALNYLTRFIESRPFLAQGSPVSLVLGNAPIAVPTFSLVTDGCLLVGDAARQLDPMTGGGIINSMVAGRLAGETIASAIERGDVSTKLLRPYEERWQTMLGRRMMRNYQIKERFLASERTSKGFMRLFIAATGSKIGH